MLASIARVPRAKETYNRVSGVIWQARIGGGCLMSWIACMLREINL
jgi:hypothetical protein